MHDFFFFFKRWHLAEIYVAEIDLYSGCEIFERERPAWTICTKVSLCRNYDSYFALCARLMARTEFEIMRLSIGETWESISWINRNQWTACVEHRARWSNQSGDPVANIARKSTTHFMLSRTLHVFVRVPRKWFRLMHWRAFHETIIFARVLFLDIHMHITRLTNI